MEDIKATLLFLESHEGNVEMTLEAGPYTDTPTYTAYFTPEQARTVARRLLELADIAERYLTRAADVSNS